VSDIRTVTSRWVCVSLLRGIMQTRSIHRMSWAAPRILVAVLGISCGTASEHDDADKSIQSPVEQFAVTPVSGPSWLHHLGLDMSETEMGQRGGAETAAHEGIRSIMRRYLSLLRSNGDEAAAVLDETFVLSGADLYRLNCQSCHGPDGAGAPPEIKSLLDPVRGTSVELTLERMKERGTPIDRNMAEELASQALDEVRNRLKMGGEKMPPFDHLRGDEVDALLDYLDRLADVPVNDRAELHVTETASRVGEHVIKGTCHICHDATGPGGGHMTMMQGIIPSLASFPQEQSLSVVLRQVEYGSSSMMGMMMRSNTMPALPFLAEDEVAAGYFYLVEYPPQP
jgi:mono/diheme cytochrome c family protein